MDLAPIVESARRMDSGPMEATVEYGELKCLLRSRMDSDGGES